jgi:hypothetical protein
MSSSADSPEHPEPLDENGSVGGWQQLERIVNGTGLIGLAGQQFNVSYY